MKSIINKPDFSPRKLSFGQVDCFAYNKSLKEELAAGLTPEAAIYMYRAMLDNRVF